MRKSFRYSATLFVITVFVTLLSVHQFVNADDTPPLYRADSVNLFPIATGFSSPLAIVSTGVPGDDRLFIAERGGKVWILDGPMRLARPFLDLSKRVSLEGERGFQSLVFDPDFSRTGYLYVNYTSSDPLKYGDTIVSRFQVSPDNPDLVDARSEYIILEVAQPANSHNGGHLAFDATDNLVIGFGDGGGPLPNVLENTQSDSLLGKMVRINVHGEGLVPENGCGRVQNYRIPADNPNPTGADSWCPEILSSGWRNPWRYSMDPANGKMWVADVGEDRFEEINIVPRTTTVLRSYGWPCFEGWDRFISECSLGSNVLYTAPQHVYARETPEGEFLGSSVTGGIIYQGETFPEYWNNYFYADFISGNIWVIDIFDFDYEPELILRSGKTISTFGMDNNKELYLADFVSGTIYQLIGYQMIEIEYDNPAFVRADSIAEWQVTVTNIGSKPIDEVILTGPVPAGVLWQGGGSIENRQLEFIFSNLEPNASSTQIWRGYLPNRLTTIDNTDFVPKTSTKYVLDELSLNDTVVAFEIYQTYLPWVD